MTTIEVGGHFEIQDGRQVPKWKNVTNGFLTQDTINYQKNTTFYFIGKQSQNDKLPLY